MPSKICIMCGNMFDWRKKWEDCWDEITTCSKSCNGDRRILKRLAAELEDPAKVNEWTMEERRKAIQNAKVENRQRKERRQSESEVHNGPGGGPGSAEDAGAESGGKGQARPASCDQCGSKEDFYVYCQIDATRAWVHLCDRCWPLASGGDMFEGDASHPHYVFGSICAVPHERSVASSSLNGPLDSDSKATLESTHNKKTKSRRRKNSARIAVDEDMGRSRENSEFDVLKEGMHLLKLDDRMEAAAFDLDREFFGTASP